MQQTLHEFENEYEPRSSFLTWLCILTFIGSGWALISCVWTYNYAPKTEMAFSERIKRDSALKREDTMSVHDKHSPFEGKMKNSLSKILKADNIRKVAIGGFISALLTLTGALLMWNLRRRGFYIYVLGVIFGIIVPFYVFGNDLIAVGASSFANFFGLVFIALYALNLKSMRTAPKEF